MKLEVSSPAEFGRNDSIEGLGSAAYLQDAFVKPVGTVLGPIMITGRNVVCKVISKAAADMAALAAERDTIRTTIRRQKLTQRNGLFYDSVVSRLTAEGKLKIHKDAITRLTAALRQSAR
jgi:hypothetical protein